ncbi:MAG: phosphate signaling complex protein PhoU [Gemmatimonadetes bacterium]|nr:phosphate signaling complex protein PhoU [Gemmatimonadota bacterium]
MTHRHFDDELGELGSRLATMAGLAEAAVHAAVRALLTRDEAAARRVLEGDRDIDALEIEIEDRAINLLALQQPMARDLRAITMAMHISSDLERVGDHAVNIAEKVHWLIEASPFPVPPELEEIVRLSTAMLRDSLDAFTRGDSALAREILLRDDRVDKLHENMFRVLLTHMLEDPRRISGGMDLFLVSGNLERIADLATNISEDVIYQIEGRNVRHHAEGDGPG